MNLISRVIGSLSRRVIKASSVCYGPDVRWVYRCRYRPDNYRSAIDAYKGYNVRTHKTAGIFNTYPQAFLTKPGQFFSKFSATALLIMGIFAIINPKHPKVIRDLAPWWIFLLILDIGACLGFETRYVMNAARDFTPRYFAYFAAYSTEVWTYGEHYSWVPVVAPLCGALTGGLVYDLLVFDGQSQINELWMGLRAVTWLPIPAYCKKRPWKHPEC